MSEQMPVREWADAHGIKIHQRSKTVWIAAGRCREREIQTKGRSPAIALAMWLEGARYRGTPPCSKRPSSMAKPLH
jgi:hypothetical protein